MKKFAIILAALGLAAGLYLGTRPRAPAPARTASVAAAPTLPMVDLAGHEVDTATLRGKVVLVNFWAAWCTPCRQEIPAFVGLQDKYRAQGFQVIGISMDDPEPALRQFYRDYKMNYPVVIGNQKIAQAYGGIFGLPTSFLIGRDGRIDSKYSGITDFAGLERDIVKQLQTPH